MKILKSVLVAAIFIPFSNIAYSQEFNLITRAQWGAQWVNFNGVSGLGTPYKITLHHTAGAYPHDLEQAKEAMRKIQRDVMSWGTDVGYHYVISPQGDVFEGIPENKLGTHAYNDNYNNIGICFMGNYENAVPTQAMNDALVNLSKYLKNKYPVIAQRAANNQNDPNPKNRAFIMHQDTYATACPGKNVIALKNEYFHRIFLEGKSVFGGDYRPVSSESMDIPGAVSNDSRSLGQLEQFAW